MRPRLRVYLTAMILATIGAVLEGSPRAAAADSGWSIVNFDTLIDIQPDAGLEVTETIDAQFDYPKHGIYREIPIRYAVGLHQYALRFTLKGVDDGDPDRPYPVDTSFEGDLVRMRIGSAETYKKGRARYRIRYFIQRAILWEGNTAWSEEGTTVLRWNATGTGWQVPVAASTVTVRMPRDLDDTRMRYDAWTGIFGEKGKAFTKGRVDPRTVSFQTGRLAPFEGISVEVTMPTDAVAPPGWFKEFGWWLADNFVYGLIPLVLGLCFSAWYFMGRDLPGMGVIVVNYEPPDGLSPAEVGTLVDEKVDLRDISATIIDLAARGYLKIEEVGEEGWLSQGIDYRFVKLKPPVGLKRFEANLFNRIFEDGNQVLLSSLNAQLYTEISQIQSDLYGGLNSGGYFDGRPDSVRTGSMIGGLFALALALLVAAGIQMAMIGRLFPLPMVIAGVISAIAIVLTSLYMPRKTKKGRVAWEKIAGLEEYIRRADAQDIQSRERQNVFERLLPYAIAFGLTKHWAKAFSDLYTKPPDWYRPSDPNNFNTWIFVDRIDRSIYAMNSTFPSQPRSTGGGGEMGRGYSSWGGGGFSGGGSSGGGFGGGGGGSW